MKKEMIIGLCTLAALVGISQCNTLKTSQQNAPMPASVQYRQASLEEITFDKARNAAINKDSKEEEIVQKYLDNILANKEQYSTGMSSWNSFSRLIYDPEFKKMDAEFKKRGITAQKDTTYQNDEKGNLAMATVIFKYGQKSDVYISRNIMQKATNQDEILSGLDHESSHACIIEKGTSHLTFELDREPDAELSGILSELTAFDLQFLQIYYGERKVSKPFIKSAYSAARVVFKELENIANSNSEQSQNAKMVYNLMLQQPTFQFFVEKSERQSKKPYQ